MAECRSVNHAQKSLLDRLRELVEETPKSGALNAAKRPLYVSRFAQAVERRASDGPALVAYVREKVHEPATGSYNALVAAGRLDLSVEALVDDEDAPWASEFTDVDRAAARARLGSMLEAHGKEQEAAEAAAVEHDREIIAEVSRRRLAKGKAPLTSEQEATMLRERAERRAADASR